MIKPNTRARGLGEGLQLGLCTSFLFAKKKKSNLSSIFWKNILLSVARNQTHNLHTYLLAYHHLNYDKNLTKLLKYINLILITKPNPAI
jgi:hypothetical protein